MPQQLLLLVVRQCNLQGYPEQYVAYPLSTEKDRKNMLHIVAVMLNHCHFNRLCLFTRTGITEVEKSGVELVSPFYEVNMACFKILWLTIYIKIIWANMLDRAL